MSIVLEVQTRKSYSDKVTVDFTINANGEVFPVTMLEANFIELLDLVGGDSSDYLTKQLAPLNTLTTSLGMKNTGVATIVP